MDRHTHQSEYEEHRASARERGYDTNWEKLRRIVLAEKPICRMCREEHRITPATQVDHIIPLARGGTNARENLQGLCARHNAAKGARQGGGTGGRT